MTSDRALATLRDIAIRRVPEVETLTLARAHGRVLAGPAMPSESTAGTSPLPTGCVLTPLRVAFAAECGLAAVEVTRRPTVAVFAIGDAVEPGLPLAGDGRHDGARDLLVGLLRADGLEPTVWPRLPADPRQVEVALRDAGCAFDSILVCGNTDALAQVRGVLESFGTLDASADASDGPEPDGAVFGTLDLACVLALPTERVRLLGLYLTLGRCLLDGLQGRDEARPVLRGRLAAAADGVRFQLVRTRSDANGVLSVFPLAPSAAMTTATSCDADALLILGNSSAPPGSDVPVDVIPLPGS